MSKAEIIDLLEYRRKKEEIELQRLKSEVEYLVSQCPVFPEPYTYNLETSISDLSTLGGLSTSWELGRSYYDYDERDYPYEFEYNINPGSGDES